MDIGEILQTEINSAYITLRNHDEDNGFLYSDIVDFERGIKDAKIIPLGICKNVPFKPSYAEYSIAFCFQYENNDHINWCHLPECLWYSLLSDLYSREKADEIISKIMGYEKKSEPVNEINID